MSTSVIIVAAGKGTRMGPDIDKLFLPVAGRPVVAHTWRRFDRHPAVDEIVLVVRAGMEEAFRELGKEENLEKPYRLVAGGRERQDSVWNGLESLSGMVDLVAIQDGARPCSDAGLISDCLVAGRENGAAVAAVREKGLLVTDDTAACDLIGQPVRLVAGRHPNPKVTVRSDIPYIELLLSASC